MNLETKITIYKFTPQVFTLTHEIFSYDWDLSEFDGTRLNSEFVSFLKEGD